MKIEARPFTNEELDERLGTRTCPIGSCYKWDGHYYMQREDSVLHTKTDIDIVNTLHVAHMNSVKEKISITREEFDEVIRKSIFNMGIYTYLNPTD